MDRAEAFAILKEAAVEVLAVDPSAVTEEARFKEDLDADSLDLVEFVMALEEPSRRTATRRCSAR
jgi:acyl carrier protein